MVTAIAWIGSSFYFVFLDASLTPPDAPDLRAKGVDGELWAVHGGGFYNPQKYLVAPKSLPQNLHWFYWESYSTWLTGVALFAVLYLFNAGSMLIDPRLRDWSPAQASGAAIGLMAGYWLVYDLVCRAFGQRRQGDVVVGVLVFLATVAAVWLACRLFPGRAAFLIAGAMLATAMSANVLVWIIPGQRAVIAQMKAGLPVDPVHGRRAKQRSVHNTYFTLPVLIAMLSNHYGWLHQGRYNWLALCVLMLSGALIRHSFVARHRARVAGRPTPWGYAAAGCLWIGAVIAAGIPADRPLAAPPAGAEATMAEVQRIVERRCVTCHSATLTSQGIALHSPELIREHAAAIHQQVVLQKTMPLNNTTQMTDDERALIGRWFAGLGR